MLPSTLCLSQLRLDGGTQLRLRQEEKLLEEYSAAMRRGEQFPPVVVFHDGQDHWLADGFHRHEAARRAGFTEITAEVRPGTRREAVLYAAGANAQHGLRRSHADKRRAVQVLLEDPEWQAWSDREIARRCAVHHELVGQLRRELSGGIRQMDRTVRRGDTVYQQNLRRTPVSPEPAGSTAPAPLPAATVPLPAPTGGTPPGEVSCPADALAQVLRLLTTPAEARAVYPGERLRLGRHHLFCDAPLAGAWQQRVPRARLGIAAVRSGSPGERVLSPKEIDALAQQTDLLAVITSGEHLPGLVRGTRTPLLRTLAAVYEGPAPRFATQLETWTPVLLFGHPEAHVPPLPPSGSDLLRLQEPPRDPSHSGPLSCGLLDALLRQFTVPESPVLAGSHLEELLLVAEVTGRVCVGVDPDVRRLGAAVARWERLTGGRAEPVLR